VSKGIVGPSDGIESFMFKLKSSCWALLIGLTLCLFLHPSPAASQSKSANEALAALGRGPTLGSVSAPVAIVEFSDFQCGYCKRFWTQTLPKLKTSYIDSGKVRFSYRHFAILGKHSEQAAQASECAAEQGKFWEYHDILFLSQGGLAFTETKLRQYARDLGLNAGPFGTCLGTGKYKEKVERETATAADLGGRGTPLFFINQRFLVGAQPFDVFQKVIDGELNAVKAERKKG
jgi:protein-disulfide isomerase